MKCTVLAAWMDENERKEFIAKAEMFGVEKATFDDKTDYDSTWTFEGPDNAVKNFVEQHFQIMEKFMPFDDLVKCVELDAIVNGVSTVDETFEY